MNLRYASVTPFDRCTAPINSLGLESLARSRDGILNFLRVMRCAGSEGFFVAEQEQGLGSRLQSAFAERVGKKIRERGGLDAGLCQGAGAASGR